MKGIRINLDSLGVFASALCMVHCLLLPFVLTGLAMVGTYAKSNPTELTTQVVGHVEGDASEIKGCELEDCCGDRCESEMAVAASESTQCCSTPTDFWIHVGLLGAVAPVGIIALGFGYHQHRQVGALAVGLVGVFLLTAALMFGHQLLSGRGEQWMTVSGSLCMVSAHLWNSRRSHCCSPCQLANDD